jgi:hypothetical protein
MTPGESSHIARFGLILTAAVLAACSHYYSKFNFRGIQNPAPAATHSLVIDSSQAQGLIRAEELRQAEENRKIRELPRPTAKDIASAKDWLKAHDKLVDLQARSAFLSHLKAMGSFEVSATAQGVIVGWSSCGCALYPGSTERLVKIRFKLRTERRTVEGWICQDAIEMLHNFDL